MQVLARYGEILAAGGEIVTASARQTEVLKARIGRELAQGGAHTWQTPSILPLGPWLEREFRKLPERPQLLAPEATTRLWQRIVEESEASERLISVRAAAREAERASRLLADWRIPLTLLEDATPEQAAFREWAGRFQAYCATHGLVARADLAAIVTARMKSIRAVPGAPVGWHGFGTLNPALAALVGALNAAGTPTVELVLAAGPATLSRRRSPSLALELEEIAGWLRTRLEANPDAQLGVIVPDLSARSATLKRLFTDRLSPALQAPGAADARAFALARGRALSEAGIVAIALDVLALGGRTIDVLILGRVLRSPYLRTSTGEGMPPMAASARAALDVTLRRLGSRELPAGEVIDRIAAGATATRPLAEALTELRRALGGSATRPCAAWAEVWPRALRAFGWPLGRELSALEYQAARSLYGTFERFAALGRVLGSLSQSDARAELEALLAATPFEPAIGSPPVLVLETLEDPGLPFDGLWVAGLTAERFPGPSAPSPFLPERLQRERGLPGASADLALAAARAALAGWQASTGELVLSVAAEDGEAILLPSGLLPEAPTLILASTAPARASEIHAARRVEPMPPGRFTVIEPGVGFSGGVRALDAQSACPFRAAAEVRLAALPLETPKFGLPRRVRGELAHDALARFWRDLRSQAALAALDPAARRDRAAAAVASAFAAYRHYLPGGRLRHLEARWLTRAILALCDVELKRAPFEVRGIESRQEIEIATHPISIRLDRLDVLGDGATVILDYKTGRGKPRRWVGEQPDALQLMVYAAFAEPPPVAVALARLPLGLDRPFVGHAAQGGVLPGVRDVASSGSAALRGYTFAGLLDEWRGTARRLATEFADGEARVNPADGACEFCALEALCRIDERSVEPEEDDDDEGAARPANGNGEAS